MKVGGVWKGLVSFAALAISFPSLVSPQNDLTEQVTENSDGIRIIHNIKGGLWGRGLGITLDLVRKIGDIDTEDEHAAFNYPSDIAVDKNGNIYVLDTKNARIQEFSPEGRYLSTIGRKGRGPGEFMLPDGLDIDREGGLVVSDAAQERIQVFPPKGGRDIRSIILGGPSFRGIRVLSSGNYVSSTSSLFEPEASGVGQKLNEARLLKVLSPDGRVLNAFGRGTDFGEGLTSATGNVCVFDVDEKDAVYLCFIFQNRVEKYSAGGKLIWRADRPLGYSTEARSPEMNACSTSIAADAKGRIWVVTYARQLEKNVETTQTSMLEFSKRGGGVTSRRIETKANTDLRSTDAFKLEIFSADGELLGDIPLSHFADVIRIHEDKLFIIDRDHGSTVYVYRIVEEQARPGTSLAHGENERLYPL